MLTRLDIFSCVSFKEFTDADLEKYQTLLDSHYDQFISLCDDIKSRDDVDTISCSIYKNDISFDITYKDGTIETKTF